MTKATITRQQESELPNSLTMDFINLNADHQQGSQQARRLAVKSDQKVQIASPIVFTDEVAKTICEQLLYNVWIERNRFTLTLPRAYARLESTDVFTLVDPEIGIQYTIRIVKATLARNGAMALECVAEFAPAYAQNSVTGVAKVVSQTPLTSSSTNIIVMDLPALRDSDNSLGYYIAMSGTTEVWGGGAVYTSFDGGASYTLLDSTATPSITGTATRLRDWDGSNTVDETNTVVLDPLLGVLSSIDMTALLNGGNLLALQSGNGWELLQFRRAVLQLDGTYMVSGLLRGRFGTEWAMGGHVSGDKFVLLDTNTVRRVPITSAQLGIPILMKALGLGQPLGSVDPISVTNRGVALKPYSPVILGGGRDSAGGAILKWVRRTRIGGAWLPYSDVPLSEAFESYEVEIWNNDYTVLKRSFAPVSVSTLTYTAAQQISDFGSVQDSVYFKVYQISSVVGRGYEARGYIGAVPPEDLSPPPDEGGGDPPLTPTLYVSPTGSDTNPGTESQPFLTITKASAVAVAGDVISVADGTYYGSFQTTKSGTSSSRITFQSATRWGAKIVPPPSSSRDYAWDSRGAYITIDGFEVDGTVDSVSGTRWRVGIGMMGEGSIAKNCHVHHIFRNGAVSSSGGAGILMDSYYNGQNMHTQGNNVHHIGPTAGGGTSHFYHGIYQTATGTIRNNVSGENTGGGIHCWHDARNIQIANNTVFSNSVGIILGGGDFVNLSGPCDYMHVHNNIVYDNTIGMNQLGDCGANNTYVNNLLFANGTNFYNQLSTTQPHTGTILADPLFVNYQADGSGDYKIQAGSPAINAALGTYAPSTDYDGYARPNGVASDIGAFEYH